MKKLACILLCIAVMLTTAYSFASAEKSTYSPALGLTMEQFISKYNAIGSSLTSPLIALDKPYYWSTYGDYNIAWYKADSKASTSILLYTKDTNNKKSTKSGLDMVQIYIEKETDFLSLITVTLKCTEIFAQDLFGNSMAPYYLSSVIKYYYENCLNTDLTAIHTIDADNTNMIQFYKSGNEYFFVIAPYEGME